MSLQFLSWTKLTMALATGSQHMNVLAPASGATPAARWSAGGAGSDSAERLDGTSILLASPDAAKFAAGSIVAVDVDYTGQTGFVGSPVAGAYVRQALTDVDYIRRVTFNVALVSQVSVDRADAGRAVARRRAGPGAKLQAVTGFVDREGGSFYQEWSALFVMQGSQGERIFFHYPRLQAMSGAEEAIAPLNGKESERTIAGTAERAVSGAAGHRSAGRRAGGLLPQLSAGGECVGVVSAANQAS